MVGHDVLRGQLRVSITKSPPGPGTRRAALISLCTGLGILGYTIFKVAYAFAKVTGWGLWLILAAAVVAVILGVTTNRKKK